MYVMYVWDVQSDLFWAHALPNKLSASLIFTFSQYMMCAGAPLTLTTDNGPEFGSALWRSLLESWGVQHRYMVQHAHTQLSAVMRMARYEEYLKSSVTEWDTVVPTAQFRLDASGRVMPF